MSEKKNKEARKQSILKYDSSVESPEDVIAADKNQERKAAFQETYKRIAKIIPEYFMTQRKKRKNSTSGDSGGTSFSQSIVVTPEKATLQTKEINTEVKEEEKQEEKERE